MRITRAVLELAGYGLYELYVLWCSWVLRSHSPTASGRKIRNLQGIPKFEFDMPVSDALGTMSRVIETNATLTRWGAGGWTWMRWVALRNGKSMHRYNAKRPIRALQKRRLFHPLQEGSSSEEPSLHPSRGNQELRENTPALVSRSRACAMYRRWARCYCLEQENSG